MSAPDWIAQLAAQRAESITRLRGVDDRQRVRPQSGWRVQDLIGHLAAWEREALAALQSHIEGDRYQPVEARERFNQLNYAKRRELDGAQLRMDWGMARRELLSVLRELSDEQLAAPMVTPCAGVQPVVALVQGLLAHEAHHLAEIERALG